MKKLICATICVLFVTIACAQVSSDSLAYQQQRAKINSMLAQRLQKFGQYDQSLDMHTGIFGFQTKRDIRRSNDILMDIVKTDDSIYRELKILLDYRTFQQKQVQNHNAEAVQSNVGYMNTINKLRNQIDQLKTDAKEREQEKRSIINRFIIAIILLAALALFFAYRRRRFGA